ncbi:MAG: hypothetical protein IPJ69_11400 [Deltaproteobacteria bacterium]|nr:MAG: hypothetical protein IPJ69_11400 [Deltaproteobacteria bacterium]
MVQEKTRVKFTTEQKLGWFYFFLFFFLVFAGIAVKRIWNHPEFMMMFHLPAAVFLLLSGFKIPAKLKQKYRDQIQRVQQMEKDLSLLQK